MLRGGKNLTSNEPRDQWHDAIQKKDLVFETSKFHLNYLASSHVFVAFNNSYKILFQHGNL